MGQHQTWILRKTMFSGLAGQRQCFGNHLIVAGVHKFNADTGLRHAFRAGLEAVFAKGHRQPEAAMAEGRSRMIDATTDKMRQYGCTDKAVHG